MWIRFVDWGRCCGGSRLVWENKRRFSKNPKQQLRLVVHKIVHFVSILWFFYSFSKCVPINFSHIIRDISARVCLRQIEMDHIFLQKKLNVCILFLNTGLILLWLKFTHISPLGYGLKEFSLGFNAVANLYPRSVVGPLVTFFDENFAKLNTDEELVKLIPKDEILKVFKKKFQLKEFVYEPSVFQHIGN